MRKGPQQGKRYRTALGSVERVEPELPGKLDQVRAIMARVGM
ncbi:MAG TPA: hypothetical protein VF765_22880 [Polyangiaceae bacterium]